MSIVQILPDPPIAADTDLSHFTWTPINRAQFFGSAFHAQSTDGEWRAGLTLKLKSWDQKPSGSLPKDDVELARLTEFGRDTKGWLKVKAGALRGWSECSDGRLYHPEVTQGVVEAEEKRRKASKKGKSGAEARWGKKGEADSTGNATGIKSDNTGIATGNPQAMPVDSKEKRGQEKTHTDSGDVRTGEPQKSEPDRPDVSGQQLCEAQIQNTYPVTDHPCDWLTALRTAARMVADGMATWQELMDGTHRYATFVAAGGVSGPRYVKPPQKFFADPARLWAQPWTPPVPKETATDRRKRADREELAMLMVKRSELGLVDFRNPFPGESPAVYDTALRHAARDAPRGRELDVVSALVKSKAMPS